MNQVEMYKHLEDSQAQTLNICKLFPSPLHPALTFGLSDSWWIVVNWVATGVTHSLTPFQICVNFGLMRIQEHYFVKLISLKFFYF